MSAPQLTFSLHFAAEAWAQIGTVGAVQFEILQSALEHCARAAEARLQAGAAAGVDAVVPIAAGNVVAECSFDDFGRSITVLHLEFWAAR